MSCRGQCRSRRVELIAIGRQSGHSERVRHAWARPFSFHDDAVRLHASRTFWQGGHMDVGHPPYDVFHKASDISAALATRMEAIADEVTFPVRLTVEEAEEVIR